MTPYEHRADELFRLDDEFKVTVETFWTTHDDMIGDVLHARTECGREFRLLPSTYENWEEVPRKDIDTESKKLYVLYVHLKLEQIVELFQTEQHAHKWVAAWVHNNRYEEMDVLDEGAHDAFESYWEDGFYADAANLWFSKTDDFYHVSYSDVHPATEKVSLYS
jgi:hypothetical protein